MPLRRCCLLFTIAAFAGAPSGVAAQAPASPADAQLMPECEVLARINSEVILACELEWQVRLMFEQRFGPEATGLIDSPMLAMAREGLLKRIILNRIDVALLYADFRSNAPHADMESIEKQLQQPFEEGEIPRLLETTGTEDLASLEAKLLKLGTSLEERRQDFVRTMIAQTWMRESVKYDKEVTHEQMLDFYRENVASYDQPDRARWEELMVRFDKHPSKREAWAALARLGNQAHSAASTAAADQPAFESLAKNESDGFNADEGGQYDWTTKGSLTANAVDVALFSQPVGQMSPILEGPMGFHIVRVIERKAAGPTPFSEVQAKIRKDLQDERFKGAIDVKLNELKRSARLWTAFTGDLSYEQLAKLQEASTVQR